MSRPIKFRAWDNRFKRYVPRFEFSMVESNEYDVEQFTGLHDKNGVEIYEGDILKHSYPAGYSLFEVRIGEWDNGGRYEDHESGLGVHAIEYRTWSVRYLMETVNYTDMCGSIIGNIHENPDLIK